MKKSFSIMFITLSFLTEGISQKIQLSKSQLLPLSHFEIGADYGKLVDGKVGIENDFTFAPTENNSEITWPHRVLIDLKGIYNITQLKAYDGYGVPTINWYAGSTPFNTNLIVGPIKLSGYNSYNTQNVTATGVRF
jgi:hypothetical protein